MQEYLKHALEFEKYVYIWSNAMDTVNEKKRQIYADRKQLEHTRTSIMSSLSTLDSGIDRKRKQKEKELVEAQKKVKGAYTATAIAFFILFLIGVGVGSIILSLPNKELAIPRAMVIPVMCLTFLTIGSLFTGIAPVCIGMIASRKNRIAKLENDLKQLSINSQNRQTAILEAKKAAAEKDYQNNLAKEKAFSTHQEEIHRVLQVAKQKLEEIYEKNVLPAKYRNFTAVASMYEYLETRQCNTIEGHGGIYDTYETERIALATLYQLIMMNEKLSRIEDYQRYIYQELREANQTLSEMKNSLYRIEKTNEEIAKNTAISAIANQQTAAATQWMAWNAWANGY